tara:strand:- start:495 stop:1571 length:1077 start_codon:yes stop_codon:yes gene_type:complete
MALWGNNDNLNSSGTVSVNYANKTVTGTGTTFGAAGAGHTEAQVGDVIRFGQAFGGAVSFHGDAVIVGIASTTHLTINSTAGLSGQEITASQFQISQSPKNAPTDAAHNQSSGRFNDPDRLKLTSETSARIGIGTTVITITGDAGGNNVAADDTVIFGSGELIHAMTVHSATATSGGISTIRVATQTGVPPTTLTYRHVFAGAAAVGSDTVTVIQSHGHEVSLIKEGDTFVHSSDRIGIGTIRKGLVAFEKRLILDTPLGVQVNAGANVDIEFGIRASDSVIVRGAETLGGKESQIVGVSTGGVGSATSTAFETGAGWVGVTTYTDTHGNLRVKKEILVAMSGIQTGNLPIYDANPFA